MSRCCNNRKMTCESMDLEQRDIGCHMVQPIENICSTALSASSLMAMLCLAEASLSLPWTVLGKHWRFLVFGCPKRNGCCFSSLVNCCFTYLSILTNYTFFIDRNYILSSTKEANWTNEHSLELLSYDHTPITFLLRGSLSLWENHFCMWLLPFSTL